MKKILISYKRKTIAFILAFMALTTTNAQTPSWAAKATKSVFTLKTFATDGSLLASTTGVFITEDGEAISSYTPFRGAQKAVVIDATGKEWTVENLMGANEMYDVAKFRVQTKKANAINIAESQATDGSEVWILPYSANKKPGTIKASVKSGETFMESYRYYNIQTTASNIENGSPVMNDKGELIGLIQPSSNTKQADAYAVSAPFAANLKLNGLSFNDPAIQATNIDIAIPSDINDALLTLFVARNAFKTQKYTDYVRRFVKQFPESADGYVNLARIAISNESYEEAEKYLQQAVKMGSNKADAHYQYAQTVLQYCLQSNDKKTFAPWTLDKALAEAREAYKTEPQSVYMQQEAQILYTQGKYDEAGDLYMKLTNSDLRSADIFYAASLCKAQKKDTVQQLALLDSAVALYNKPYLKEAAPFLLARAQARHDAGKYRLAVADYNEYGTLMVAQLDAPFYYMREQSEVAGRLYQQALSDIDKAVELAPQATLYLAEKAALLVRVAMYKEAIEASQQLITLAPDESDGYYFLGAAQWLSDNKKDGMANLQKAKQMGNTAVQIFMDRHTK